MEMDPKMIEELAGTFIGMVGDLMKAEIDMEIDGPGLDGMYIDASPEEDGAIAITVGDIKNCHAFILTRDQANELAEKIDRALDEDEEDPDGPDVLIVAKRKRD